MGKVIRFMYHKNPKFDTYYDFITTSDSISSLDLEHHENEVDNEAELTVHTPTENYIIHGQPKAVKELYEGLIGILYVQNYDIESFSKTMLKYSAKISMLRSIVNIDLTRCQNIDMYNFGSAMKELAASMNMFANCDCDDEYEDENYD